MIELRAAITGENAFLVVLEGSQVGFNRNRDGCLCHCRHHGLLIVGLHGIDLLDSSGGKAHLLIT